MKMLIYPSLTIFTPIWKHSVEQTHVKNCLMLIINLQNYIIIKGRADNNAQNVKLFRTMTIRLDLKFFENFINQVIQYIVNLNNCIIFNNSYYISTKQPEIRIVFSQPMSSKLKVVFELNTSHSIRIKQLTIHPIKQWVGIINQNNTFSLWNYQQKILIKSFSCNTLDDSKSIQIKQIVFFDKHSLCSGSQNKNMKNNIIFVTNNKLIFYDYVSDTIKQTTQKDLDQKHIKKVCVYSENKICIAVNDGSFKVLDTKQNQTKGNMYIKTVKGYHTKPITWIFAYSQNYNEMPRIITASDQDGMMACWNVDMILKSSPNAQTTTPSFKFQLNKKFKQNITNQQIISLQHDPSTYRLITSNERYIRLWSTMTGIEQKRIKNQKKYRQVLFFNNFSYMNQCFVAHSKSSNLMVVRNSGGAIAINDQIQLRNFFTGINTMNPQQQFQISHSYTLPHHPSNLFIITNLNMIILQLDKFYIPPYGYHNSFITKLSTINSRDLIIKTTGEIRKDIKSQQINNLKFDQQILINTFFLSADQQSVYFNLLEIQYSTMLHQTRKYKLFNLQENSPLKQVSGGRSVVLINFQGNQIIIFNKLISSYQIYAAYNQHETEDLLRHNHDIPNRIQFYSKFYLISSGYCRDIIYHQYKNQFAVIVGFDDKDKFIQLKETKQKKGFFKGKQEINFTPSSEPVKFKIYIYQKVGKQYKLIEKSQFFTSKLYKLYSFGSFYGYSVSKGTLELIEIISSQKGSLRETQGILYSPEHVYVNYCESYYVLSFDKYFIVFKVQQNGSMCFFRSFEYTLLHGYFWQKFFFFLTESALYFMHILNEESIVIKIADISNLKLIQKVIDDIEDDDFQPECQVLPPGQQQILTLINMNLVLVNENGNPTLISLNEFPYIVFCLEIACGYMGQCISLYRKASKNIAHIMRETMTNYGMIAPDLIP